MREKGQVSIEFLIVVILLFAILLFSLAVFTQRNTGYIQARQSREASLLADGLAREINAVYLAGTGTETSFLVEKRSDFNVSFLGNSLIVEWENGYVDRAVLTDNISVKSLSQGQLVSIRNVSGGIEIENA